MRQLAILLVSAIVLSACGWAGASKGETVAPTGSGGERRFEVGAFDKVSLGGHYDVVVEVGPAQSVRAEGDADQLDKLEVALDGSTLRIRTKRGNWRFGNPTPPTVYVTAPALTAAAIGGSGDMRIDKIEGNAFSASIGGSGDMDIAALRVANADFSIAGSGTIRAAGRATKAEYSIAGSGDLDAPRLEADTASISVAGSGNVRARATQTANVSIVGSGDVELGGGARCQVNSMGSGEVRCNRA